MNLVYFNARIAMFYAKKNMGMIQIIKRAMGFSVQVAAKVQK